MTKYGVKNKDFEYHALVVVSCIVGIIGLVICLWLGG